MKEKQVTKYEHVAAVLRKRLQTVQYPVGSLLPPEPQLQEEFGVSRVTIRSAIQMLVREGLLSVRQGRGTEVLAASFNRYESVIGMREELQPGIAHHATHIDLVPIPDPADADFLGVPHNATVWRLQRLLLTAGEQAVGICTNYLPLELVPDFKAHEGQFTDLYTFLVSTYGIHYDHATDVISAASADLLEAEVLHVPVGSPLLISHRQAYSTDGPMECSSLRMLPANYKIIITMEEPAFSR